MHSIMLLKTTFCERAVCNNSSQVLWPDVWPDAWNTVTPLGGVTNGTHCKPTFILTQLCVAGIHVLLCLGAAPPHVLQTTARGTLSALAHNQQGFAVLLIFPNRQAYYLLYHLSHHPQCQDVSGPAAQCPLCHCKSQDTAGTPCQHIKTPVFCQASRIMQCHLEMSYLQLNDSICTYSTISHFVLPLSHHCLPLLFLWS